MNNETKNGGEYAAKRLKGEARMLTGAVRLSYVHLLEPRTDENGQARYSVCVLIDKSDKSTLEMLNACINEAKAKGAQTIWGGRVPANAKCPPRDGDTERPGDAGYKGCMFFNSNTMRKPGVLDLHKAPVTSEDQLYSGVYARVALSCYPYNKGVNKGVAIGVDNVLVLGYGDRLSGGGASAEADFEGEFAQTMYDDL